MFSSLYKAREMCFILYSSKMAKLVVCFFTVLVALTCCHAQGMLWDLLMLVNICYLFSIVMKCIRPCLYFLFSRTRMYWTQWNCWLSKYMWIRVCNFRPGVYHPIYTMWIQVLVQGELCSQWSWHLYTNIPMSGEETLSTPLGNVVTSRTSRIQHCFVDCISYAFKVYNNSRKIKNINSTKFPFFVLQ